MNGAAMTPTLTFHGAAGCVTGFCARLVTEHATVLIDCGMFQGSKTLKALNYQPFPFDVGKVDAVLLTHAHIDHSGLLPKLMLAGFEGPIYATAATRDLAAVMLVDAGGIQENEVESLNRRNQRRGIPPVEPIYTAEDGKAVAAQFRKAKLGEPVAIAEGVTATWWPAGHMLGSASIAVEVGPPGQAKTLLFSGDLGPGGSPFVDDPDAPAGVDHLIIESTYGDRERTGFDSASRRLQLAEEVRAAHAAGGPLLIPAFAVERSQELLVDLLELMEAGDVPEGDIFLDSPLAIEATKVFQARGWRPDAQANPFEALKPSKHLRFLSSPSESDGLDRLSGWHIILAASGMCDAGRVRKHLKRLLWRKEATVLLCGYQATGTLGRLLAEGAPRVSIRGDEVRVRARIRQLDAYSGHADASGLVAWAKARLPVSGTVFIAHGEPDAAQGLSARLVQAGFAAGRIAIPALDERFVLGEGGAVAAPQAAPRLPARAPGALDWHNQRADFQLRLGETLKAAASDAEREELLKGLQAFLDARRRA